MNTQTIEVAVAEQQVEAVAVVQLPLSTLALIGGGQAITSFY